MTNIKKSIIALLAGACVLAGCNALNQPADISKAVNGTVNSIHAPKPGHLKVGGMDFIFADSTKNNGNWLIKIPANSSYTIDVSDSIKQSGKYVYLLHATDGSGFGGRLDVEFGDGRTASPWVKGNRDIGLLTGKPKVYDNALPVYVNKDKTSAFYLTRYVVEYAVGGARPEPVKKITFSNESHRNWYVAGVAVSDSETPTTENFVYDPEIWKPIDMENLDIKRGSALDLTEGMTGKPCGIDGRVVIGKTGHFEFENKPGVPVRFKGTNLRLANRFPVKKNIVDPSAPIVTGDLVRTHADIDAYVNILKKQGYNAVRWRPAFRGEAEYKAPHVLYEDIQDMYDYYIYALKREGIYIFYYLCSNDIGDPNYRWDDRNTVKVKMMFGDKSTRENWVKLAKAQLEHVNPYTKMALKDDPVVATLEYWNEFEQGAQNYGKLTKEGRDILKANYAKYLQKKYGTVEKFLKANPNLKQTIPVKKFEDVDISIGDNRTNDYGDFVVQAMRETNAFWENTIRNEIGMKAPIHQNNCARQVYWAFVGAESGSYNAINTYHCHPSTYRIGGIVPGASQLENDAEFWRKTVIRRIAGMTTAVTEYQHCHFNPFKHEAGIIFPAYSAYQDYGALIVFDAAVAPKGGELGYFNVAENPILRANDFINYFLFYRGDVKVSPNRVDFLFDDKAIKTNPAFASYSISYSMMSLMSGFAINFPTARKIDELKKVEIAKPALTLEPSLTMKPDEMEKILRKNGILSADNQTDAKNRIFQTDTKEITMRSKEKLVKVVTPKTEAITMLKSTKNEKLGNLTIKSVSTDVAIALSSLDNKPLDKSDKLILTIATDTAMSGFGVSKNRLYVTGWGKMPVIIETGKFFAELNVDPNKKFTMYSLKMNGERIEEIPLEVKNGKLILDVNTTKHTAVFFEIVAKK